MDSITELASPFDGPTDYARLRDAYDRARSEPPAGPSTHTPLPVIRTLSELLMRDRPLEHRPSVCRPPSPLKVAVPPPLHPFTAAKLKLASWMSGFITPDPAGRASPTLTEPAGPASPTPTEPADEEPPVKVEEPLHELLARHNIKVRDYAFQPDPTVPPTLVVSNPLLELIEYDNILFEQPRKRPVPGRTLRRLLDVGWVTPEESERDWTLADWRSLREYDASGPRPWRPRKVAKMSDEEREEGRWQRAQVLGTLNGRVRPPRPRPPPISTVISEAPSETSTRLSPADKGKRRAHDVEAPEGAESLPKKSRLSPETPTAPPLPRQHNPSYLCPTAPVHVRNERRQPLARKFSLLTLEGVIPPHAFQSESTLDAPVHMPQPEHPS